MSKNKSYSVDNIKTNIEELEKVGTDLLEVSNKYKNGTIGNKILISFYNQNLRKIQELCEILKKL